MSAPPNRNGETGDRREPPADRQEARKRRYERPRLTDYGLVSKLTQTGGITTRDTGNMFRQCL